MDDPEITITEQYKFLSSEEKQEWGDGPWVNEPDFLAFDYKGYACVIARNLGFSGALNGYVEIPKGHPWYEKHYDEIDVECHGGSTFAQELSLNRFAVGFDCAHSEDFQPKWEMFRKAMHNKVMKNFPEFYSTFIYTSLHAYKDINFVINEIKSIVHQAIKAQKELKNV